MAESSSEEVIMAYAPKLRRPCVYFSFRSPYSWLAFHDLTIGFPDVVTALEWRPFWEPDLWSDRLLTEAGGRFIYTPMSREKHFYMLGDVQRLSAHRGLTVTWPVDHDPSWEVAHLAYLVAAEQGRGIEFIDRVYRARWQQGRDITDPATIAELAADVGVPTEAANGAAEDERVRRLGVEALLAIDRDDVFGVPFFINRRQKFWGVDRLPDFLKSLGKRPRSDDTVDGDAFDGASACRVPVPADDLRSSDHGHAGGCG
jgi:2-hydroxychromene-2-carboxylate isomerase